MNVHVYGHWVCKFHVIYSFIYVLTLVFVTSLILFIHESPWI